MKKTLSTLSLLLVLALVSTGPGIAWAAPLSQTFQTYGSLPAPDLPDTAPGTQFECQGDPDDAITGNRYSGSIGPEDDSDDDGDFPSMPNLGFNAQIPVLDMLILQWSLGSI